MGIYDFTILGGILGQSELETLKSAIDQVEVGHGAKFNIDAAEQQRISNGYFFTKKVSMGAETLRHS